MSASSHADEADWRDVLEYEPKAKPGLITLACRVETLLRQTASADKRRRYATAYEEAKRELGL